MSAVLKPAIELRPMAEADLPAVMADLARAPGDTLCHRIRY